MVAEVEGCGCPPWLGDKVPEILSPLKYSDFHVKCISSGFMAFIVSMRNSKAFDL